MRQTIGALERLVSRTVYQRPRKGSALIIPNRCRTMGSSYVTGPAVLSTMEHHLHTSSRYEYHPLTTGNSIRLLLLKPGMDLEPLQISFVEHQIPSGNDTTTSVVNYKAISYTWHPESGGEEYDSVFCDGGEIRVTKNLANLLYRVRSDSDNVLWIDQLCINQRDSKEKEHQIPLMRQIYQQCQKVVFWIGEEDQDTSMSFEMIGVLHEIFCKIQARGDRHPSLAHLHSSDPQSRYELSQADSSDWWPLMELFERGVFQRLWIVQEIVLAPTVEVRCGSHTIPFEELGNAAAFLNYAGWISHLQEAYVRSHAQKYIKPVLQDNVDIIEDVGRVDFINSLYNRRLHFQSGETESLEHLLGSLRRCKTSRDFLHDKIYALLGLAAVSTPGQIPAALLPSYGKSYTEVFRDTTRYLLEQGSLGILSHIEDVSLRSETANLPSWVPNFDVFQRSTILGLQNNANEMGFVAGGQEKVTCSFDNQDILELDAYKIDDVLLAGPAYEKQSQEEFLEESSRLVDLLRPYPTGEAMVDAFWRTLIANNDTISADPVPDEWRRHFAGFCMQSAVELRLQHEMSRLEAEDTVSEDIDISAILSERLLAIEGDHKNFVLLVQTEKHTIPLAPYTMKSWAPGLYNVFTLGMLLTGRVSNQYLAENNASLYRKAMRHVCYYRRVFTTASKGYLGIGPRSLEPGDGVFVLRGGRVPFILRKVDGNKFSIVGECFVHGVMHGEAVQGGNVEWTRIRIGDPEDRPA